MLRIFTIAYGERYLDWFERACVRSLMWPRNRAALRAAEAWDVWTTPEDAPRAEAIAKASGIPVVVHDTIKGAKEDLLQSLTGQMQLVRDRGAFLFAAPDNVFGDGSVASLLAIATVPKICVAVAPLRVAAEGFLEAMGPGPLTNPQLVKLAFERLHPTVAKAESSVRETSSYASGVFWRKLGDGLYAVTHRMPSAYLMQPTKGDMKWFKHHPKFGWFDHWFPQTLKEQQRERVIGSSDAAFIVELTSADVGNVPSIETDVAAPDKFVDGDREHYMRNRNFVLIWRAE